MSADQKSQNPTTSFSCTIENAGYVQSADQSEQLETTSRGWTLLRADGTPDPDEVVADKSAWPQEWAWVEVEIRIVDHG